MIAISCCSSLRRAFVTGATNGKGSTSKLSRKGNPMHHPNAGVTSRVRSIDEQLKKTTSRSFIAREIEARTKFKAWYRSFKKKYNASVSDASGCGNDANISHKGPISFSMNNRPSSSLSHFPNNPLFILPPPPLNDESRWMIHKEWKTNPTLWTPRRLSLKYNCSIKRIEAILILKEYHSRLIAEGDSILLGEEHKKYAASMEALLCSKPTIINSLKHLEKLPPPPPSGGKPSIITSTSPLLVSIPKDSTITPAVAAILLQRHTANTGSSYGVLKRTAKGKIVPLKSGNPTETNPDLPFCAQINIEQRTQRPWTLGGTALQKGKFIQRDIWEVDPKNKTIWSFLDSSLPTRSMPIQPIGQTLIRELNGDLREAGSAEHLREYKRMNQILKDKLINLPFTKRDQTLGTSDSKTALKRLKRKLRNDC